MNEKPLERLNYFNGQRLQAGDFKLEQDYHMRVRRWLNRSLYTQGIAMGLEVYAVPNAAQVRVEPGLAIEHLGREIILLEPRTVDVVHDIGQGQKVTDGPYLVIRYHEEMMAQQDACCTPNDTHGDKAAQGGPSRVLAEPLIECVPDLPHEASGKILLGRIELASGCGSIAYIDTSVRRYIGEGSASKVRQYALEGFRDIDPDNPAVIRFDIRGQQPNSVTLVLHSEKFPSYFYTELGVHGHTSDVDGDQAATTGVANGIDSHTHDGSSLTSSTNANSQTVHGFASNSSYSGAIPPSAIDAPALINLLRPYPLGPMSIHLTDGPAQFDGPPQFGPTPPMMLRMVTTVGTRGLNNGDGSPNQEVPHLQDLTQRVGLEVRGGVQTILGSTGDRVPPTANPPLHTHPISASIDPTGVDIPARKSGKALTFVEGLRVVMDGQDVTDRILQQIRNSRPTAENWSRLGQGTGAATDALYEFGSGAIRLDYLVPLDEREHSIVLQVPRLKSDGSPNGGRIQYNIYVE
jgi:hypothetical protein